MDKKLFDALLASVTEMDHIAKGKKKPSRTITVAEPPVQTIRERTGLSQMQFARLIGVSKRTLENWEQGRRRPTGPARALLKLVDHDPEHAIRTLNG